MLRAMMTLYQIHDMGTPNTGISVVKDKDTGDKALRLTALVFLHGQVDVERPVFGTNPVVPLRLYCLLYCKYCTKILI